MELILFYDCIGILKRLEEAAIGITIHTPALRFPKSSSSQWQSYVAL